MIMKGNDYKSLQTYVKKIPPQISKTKTKIVNMN